MIRMSGQKRGRGKRDGYIRSVDCSVKPAYVATAYVATSSRRSLVLSSQLFKLLLQSGPQDQKSVTFLHSVISLNQLLQNSKNTAYVFLTFRMSKYFFLRIFCIMFNCCTP